MMEIIQFFRDGVHTTNQRLKVAVYLWLVNLVFSLLIVMPIYHLFDKTFSRSLAADYLVQGMDFLWLGDIFYKYQNLYPALIGWIIFPGILFLFLSLYLEGGIIGRIAAADEKVDLGNFFGDCGKYFFRFFRVFLISCLGYLIVFGIIFMIVSALLSLWTKNASTEWPLILSSNLKFLIMVLLFSLIRMFFDYVKVRLVAEKSKKTIKATLLNFSFIGKRFFRAWLLYLLVGLVTIILAVVYLALYQPLPKLGFLLVIAFIWQQAYIFSKMWTKVLFFSTEYRFFIHYRTYQG
jgi:hypothetical protein